MSLTCLLFFDIVFYEPGNCVSQTFPCWLIYGILSHRRRPTIHAQAPCIQISDQSYLEAGRHNIKVWESKGRKQMCVKERHSMDFKHSFLSVVPKLLTEDFAYFTME